MWNKKEFPEVDTKQSSEIFESDFRKAEIEKNTFETYGPMLLIVCCLMHKFTNSVS